MTAMSFCVVFATPLFALSVPLTLQLQQLNLHGFSSFFSHFLFYLPVLYLLVCPLILKDKSQAFYNLFLASIGNYCYGILKLLLAHWRPSMVDQRLANSGRFCEKEYGSPSGHSVGAFCFWFICARDLRGMVGNPHLGHLLSQAMAVCSVVVCLTRLYFGVHSIDQVLFGMALGYLVFTAGDFYKRHLAAVLFGEVFSSSAKKSLWRNTFFLTWVCLSAVLSGLFVFRFHAETTRPGYFDQITNCLSVKGDFLRNFSVSVYERATVSTAVVWAALGMRARKQSVHVQLNSLHNASGLVVVWRLCLNLVPFLAILKVSTVRLPSAWLMIGKQMLVLPVLSYCYGRFYGVFSRRVWLMGAQERKDD